MRFPWLLLFRLALVAWSRLKPADADAQCAALLTEWERHQRPPRAPASAPASRPSSGWRVLVFLPRLSLVGWLWLAFFGWFLYSLADLVWFVWSRN